MISCRYIRYLGDLRDAGISGGTENLPGRCCGVLNSPDDGVLTPARPNNQHFTHDFERGCCHSDLVMSRSSFLTLFALTQFRHSYIPMNKPQLSRAGIFYPHWWQTDERTKCGTFRPPRHNVFEASDQGSRSWHIWKPPKHWK